MSVSIPRLPRSEIVYPDSDGKPMAENTLQFRWIVTIKEGLEQAFRHRPDVFVAGDLLWYPVEGKPRYAPPPTPWWRSGGRRVIGALTSSGRKPGSRPRWFLKCSHLTIESPRWSEIRVL